MDTLDEVRQLWKEFWLNNSFGAGMAIIENGEVIKSHGRNTNTDHLKEMPDSIVFAKKGKLHG